MVLAGGETTKMSPLTSVANKQKHGSRSLCSSTRQPADFRRNRLTLNTRITAVRRVICAGVPHRYSLRVQPRSDIIPARLRAVHQIDIRIALESSVNAFTWTQGGEPHDDRSTHGARDDPFIHMTLYVDDTLSATKPSQ